MSGWRIGPAALELGRVAAHRGPRVADAQPGVPRRGLAHEFFGLGQVPGAGEHLHTGRRRGDAAAWWSGRTPSADSNERSVRDTAAWETPSLIAASVNVPVSTIATRDRGAAALQIHDPAYACRDECILRMHGRAAGSPA